MKTILIDPFNKTVTEHEYSGNFEDINKAIQCEPSPFCTVSISNIDHIFVDDEGLFKEDQMFFLYEGYPQPLAGRGLIIGCDYEGESTDTNEDIEDIKDRVTFMNAAQVYIYAQEHNL